MNKSDLLDKIKSLLNRMRDHETPDNVTSKEELGPLLKDAEDLLETVSVLKYLIEEEQEVSAETETIIEREEVVQEDETSEPIPEPVDPAPVLEESQSRVEEKSMESTIPVEVEEVHEISQGDNAPQPGDTNPEATVNDLGLSSQEQVRVADKLESEAVVDLQSAIGLNERFLYITELFDGNDQAYQGAIEQLNAFTHVEEAMKYIRGEISDKFNWDQEQESTISFYALIEKRYAN